MDNRSSSEQLFIISRKGGILLVVENFIYRSNLKRHGRNCDKIYWECLNNRSSKCRSRIKSIGDSLYVTNEVHNHDPPVERIDLARQGGMLMMNKLTSLAHFKKNSKQDEGDGLKLD